MALVSRTMIAIPSLDYWMAEFGMCLTMLVAYEVGRGKGNLRIHNHRSSMLYNSRDHLASTALEWNATHLFFVDSDMTFPHNTLERLLAWEVDCVACNCPTKRRPANPTGFVAPGEPLYSRPGDRGLRSVWRVGTGIMLVRSRALRAVKMPRFPIRWNHESLSFRGEDWCFVENLEEAGVKVHIDQGLSCEIGHIGTYTYTHKDVEDAEQEREAT